MMLFELFTVTLTADASPNLTAAPFWKFDPLIATTVPPAAGPVRGVNDVIAGGVGAAFTTSSPTMLKCPLPHDGTVHAYVNVPGVFAVNVTLRC